MKLMIASDLHGSAFYTRKLVEAFEKEQAEKLLLLGDILGTEEDVVLKPLEEDVDLTVLRQSLVQGIERSGLVG